MSEEVIIHITYPRIYEFDGWTFEYHRTKPFPPWPLKKDGEPRKKAGLKFWDMFQKFNEMTIEQQELCRK